MIFLVRHATPDWSRIDLSYHLPPGPPLTPQGEREATALAEYLRSVGVRQLYTSPLERCLRTAQIVAEALGVPALQEAGLREWVPGESETEVRARFRPVWERAGGGETNGHQPEPAALITHGGPIALLLADLGMDANTLAHYRRTFDRNNPLPPAGVWRVARPAPGAPWQLTLAYLPEAYRKKGWYV